MKAAFSDFCLDFSRENGGFPTKITQYLRNGRVADVVHTDTPWLTVTLADGRVAVPVVQEDSLPRMRQDEDGTQYIQFNNVGFAADGELLHNWRMSLDYEIYVDGNCFLSMTYQGLDKDKPAVSSFLLRLPMDFGCEDDVTWEYWCRRPKFMDPTGITDVAGFIRNVTEKKDTTFDYTMPGIGFDFGRKGRPSRHIEWFIEDQLSLDGTPDHVETRLRWENGSPVLEYEFATEGMTSKPYPYYWHNKLCLTIGQTPKIRDKAPLRYFHYIDEYEHLPTLAQVRKMADEGCDVLNLHECWRSDLRCGGNPFDQQHFLNMVEECHRNDIRVAPYIRGDGETAREDSCDWFKYYLNKDYDGIYSDYGSPFGFYQCNDTYPGGRFEFKRFYKHFKRLREQTIGKDGVFTVHTGPFFTDGVMTSLVDGYVSGEGEHGIMIQTRRENAFFSQATCCPGALWTGAFPAYRTERILPFLANIGQSPFVMLGEQWHSCALALSPEPGNATFARPLWKLYGLMKNERQLRFDNDLCDETLVCDSDDTGVALFTMQDGSVLYLLSNFAGASRLCSTNQTLCCKAGQKCYRMDVSYEGASSVALSCGDKVEAELPAYGICGFLVAPVNEKWAERLAIFNAPYPAKDAADLAYEKRVEDGAAARFTCKPTKTLYLKVDVPFYDGVLEMPFWTDMCDNYSRLYATDAQGSRTLLGCIGKQGLQSDAIPEADRLWPGQESPWIALHELVGKGKFDFELRATTPGGDDCHSHIHALVAETPDGANARDITFFGELDEDRTRLTFTAELA